MSLKTSAKAAISASFLGVLASGCGIFYKGPRESFTFAASLTNDSAYGLSLSLQFDERSFEDECSKSSDTVSIDVGPGETKSVTTSVMCHLKPTSKAFVTFPSSAAIADRNLNFESNKKITCTSLGCEAQ